MMMGHTPLGSKLQMVVLNWKHETLMAMFMENMDILMKMASYRLWNMV